MMPSSAILDFGLWDQLTPDKHREVRQRLAAQRRLLRRCVERGLDLADELRKAGLSYDDLLYSTDFQPSYGRQVPESLASFSTAGASVPYVSFFTGSGGMDLGLESTGFKNVAAVEHNELFCQTLRLNHKNWNVIGPPTHAGDVSDLEGIQAALEAFVPACRRGFDGLFVGGPPCQPFSIAANQRFSKSGKNFKRVGFAHTTNGNLLFDFIELIQRFRPRAFLVENVPGLMDVDGGDQLRRAYGILEAAGYHLVPPTVLNASHFGVPQHRKRLFVVGWRGRGGFSFPSSVRGPLACGPVLALPIGGAPNHQTRTHSAASVLRYMELDYGKRDQLGRVDRLNPYVPSKTIIAGGVSGGGRSHLHPHIPRTLSVRECARLQTFPDDYEFVGPSARQFTQVGNAVPPLLAAHLARQVRKLLF